MAWNLGKNVDIKHIDKNTITCTFNSTTTKEAILDAGPWAVRGATMNLIPWPPHLTLDELDFTYYPFWIQVHNIPPNRTNVANAEKIGTTIGCVLCVDDTISSQRARKFLCIKVLVDTTKSLKTGCFMNREDGSKLWLPFRYERLSDFCYSCGKIDHTESACTNQLGEGDNDDDPRYQYGPWMHGQSLGSLKKMETQKSRSKVPAKEGGVRQDTAGFPTPLTSNTSSSAPLQTFLQIGNHIKNTSHITLLPSRQIKIQTPDRLNLLHSASPNPTTLHVSPPFQTTMPSDVIHTIPLPPLPTQTLKLGQPNPLTQAIACPTQNPCMASYDHEHPSSLLELDLSTHNQKRKHIGLVNQQTKIMKNAQLDDVHDALDRLTPFHHESLEEQEMQDTLATTMNIQASNPAMLEEWVTITCRCFIHVKRQARGVRPPLTETTNQSISNIQHKLGRRANSCPTLHHDWFSLELSRH